MVAKQKKLKLKYTQIYQVQELNLKTELENIRANNTQDEYGERNLWYVSGPRPKHNDYYSRVHRIVINF